MKNDNSFSWLLIFFIQSFVVQGVGGREAVWQRRYFCIVGPFLYVLENPESRSYKQYFRFGHVLKYLNAEALFFVVCG